MGGAPLSKWVGHYNVRWVGHYKARGWGTRKDISAVDINDYYSSHYH